MNKIFGVVLIPLLLNGCAAIASIPLPLRITNNLHTAVTVVNNMDDDPDNDGWIVDSAKVLLLRNDRNIECQQLAESTTSIDLAECPPQLDSRLSTTEPHEHKVSVINE